MANNINIAVNVSDNGTTAQATAEAKKLAQALQNAATAAAGIRVPVATAAARQGVAASQPSMTPARAAAAGPSGTASDTNLGRGVAGATGAAGRDFAAQAQGLGGLVHVYATFAANLYAASAAFGALSKAADTANIIKGLEQLGAASGRSLGALAKQMALASDGAISLRQAMTSTALATSGGMTSDAILRMTEVAKKASLALGRDMGDSMDRLTKGIIKIQPELLDELGIMARVIPSQQAYARTLGKSVEALSDFEKRQAFANAVLKEGEDKYNNINIQANGYTKLAASLSNLATEGLNAINVVLLPIAKLLSESPVGLTLAVGTVAGILLKQAIPALGQYRKGLEDIKRINLEKAANKSDILTDTGQYDAAQAERSKQAFLARSNYATKSATEQAKLMLEGERIHAAVLARNEARSNSFLGHETLNQKIINKAYAEAAASNIRSDVAQTQSRYGLVAAWKRLNEEINVSKTTGQLLKLGDGVEAVAPKTNMLQNGFMRLTGAALILGTAIGTIIEAFSGWIIVITAVLAGIHFLIDYNKIAGKEAEKFSKSLDLLNDASKTVDDTLDNINRKPFLQQIGRESLSAKANALGGLSDALVKVGKDAKELETNMGWWDKLSDARIWHGIANAFTFKSNANLVDQSSLANDTSKALSQSIIDAAKIVEGGPAEAQFKASISRVIGVSYASIADLKLKLGSVGDTLLDKEPGIISTIEDISKTIRTAAADGESLKTAWDAAAKSWDSIVASLSTKDPLGKLGEESMAVGMQMQKAFGDTNERLAELSSLTTNFEKLRMLNPDTQRELLTWGYTIQAAGKEVEVLNTKLKEQEKTAAEAAKAASDLQNKYKVDRPESSQRRKGPYEGAGRDVGVAPQLAIANKLEQTTAQQVEDTKKKIQLLKDSMQNDTLYLKAQNDAFTKGALQIENSIAIGFQKSGIEVQLRALSGNNTTEGIRQSARLQERLIGIQIQGIEANKQLIIATNNLARITEDVAIEEGMKKVNAPGFTGNREKEMAILQERSKANQLSQWLMTRPRKTVENLAMDSTTTLNGKPAQSLSSVDPKVKAAALGIVVENKGIRAGELEQGVLANTNIANKLQEQKDLAVAISETQRAGLEATLAEANARLSILSSLEKYSPIVTKITQQNRESEEAATRQTQQQLTMLSLTSKLRAEQAALAFMKKNPKLYEAGTQEAATARIGQINAEIAAQTRKDTAENSTAARKNADQRYADAKKNFDYESSVRKQQLDWDNEAAQNITNIASIRLGILTGMKSFQESDLIDQQRSIDISKELNDSEYKLANLKETSLTKQNKLKQDMKELEANMGSQDYTELEQALLKEQQALKKQVIDLGNLHRAKLQQIEDMSAYSKALAKNNEEEQIAAKIRQSAQAKTNIAQINLNADINNKSFLDEEIIARQKVIDLQKQQDSYTETGDAIRKKYRDELIGPKKIAEEGTGADQIKAKAKVKELEDQRTRELDDLAGIDIATRKLINSTADYNEKLAELTKTQALAQGQRAVDAAYLANQEALGTVSTGTAAIRRGSAAKENLSEQYAKDTLAVQEKLDKLEDIAFEKRTFQESQDIRGYENKLAFYKKQLGYQTQIIDNDTNTGIQLAENASMLEKQNLLISTAANLTQNLTTVFGDLGATIGSVGEALAKMLADEATQAKLMADLRDQEVAASKELMKTDDADQQLKLANELARIQDRIKNAEQQSAAQQLANGALLAGQAKKLFEQKTVGYKVLGALEKVASTAAAASNVIALATTAKNIAASIPGVFAKFMEQFGWPGIGIAAGALAALGIAVSEAPGGGGTMVDMAGKTSEDRQKTQGTGGVFGDEKAKTATIVNSLEMLAKNSIEGLNYDNELLKAMRKVADAVTGAAKSIYANSSIRTGGFGTALKDTSKAATFGFSGLGSVGTAVDKVLGSIFGGGTSTTQKITSAGLQLQGTFDQVMKDVSGSIQQFKDVLTTSHTDGGWFGNDSDSSSLSRETKALGSKSSQAIADIFGSAAQMFVELGKKTGVTASQIQTTLENFDVSMPIDLMNKTGQELVDELNAVIGEKISGAAEKIFTGFDQYRNFGEDYLATVLRVVDANDKVNQSLLAMGHAFSVIGRFDITEAMVNAAGGLEAFQTQALFFHDNFLTAAEKLAPVQKGVNDQLTKLGITTSITRDQYKQLVISQDLSTRGGREMYQSLMELAPGFDMVTKSLDDLAVKSLDLEAKIYELIGKKSDAIAIARNKELAAMDASLRPRQLYINALTDEIAIRDRLKSAYDASNKSVNAAIVSLNNYKTALLAGAASTLTPAQKYADATAIFKATAQAAAATITTSSTAADIATRDEAVAKLSSVSDSFLANSKEMNAGTAQYAADLALVTTAVNDATTAMGTQLSDAKLQLGFLDTIAAATQTTADILTEYLAAQGVTSIAQTTSATSGSVASTYQIPGHADGGLAKGISIVGENGPELVDFKNPGRVYSNQASNELFSTKELVEEIKSLRKEVANLRADQQEQTGHLITSTYDANMKNAEAITTGNQEALNNQNWNTRSKVKIA